MNFFIKKGATQPTLVMRINRDNRFSYEKVQKALENSTITFSMADNETNILKVGKQAGGLLLYESEDETIDPEYYIYYKFTQKDTSRPGNYKAEFKIEFYDTIETDMTGIFIAPLHDELIVVVSDSLFTETNHVSNFNDHVFFNVFQNQFK